MLISRLLIALGAALFLFAPTAAAAPEESSEPPLWAYALKDKNPYDSGEPLDAPKQPVAGSKAPKTTIPSTGVKALVEAEFGSGHIMVRIAQAESQFQPHAKNPKSTATGVFQILSGTWAHHKCTGSRTNASDNIRCARKIYNQSGTVPWLSSADMW